MAKENPEKYDKIDPLETIEPVSTDIAVGELTDFLFHSVNGNPFGADRFTIEQLKEKFFAQEKKNIVTPIPPSAFPEALKFLCDSGLLGFNEETKTYYDRESA